MSLINAGSIKLPVHRAAETTAPANDTLVFDDSTGALVPAAHPAPPATAPLVESLGAEWLIVLPSLAAERTAAVSRNANKQ
jgi:hypothetical protein